MITTFQELCDKEVINCSDGSIIGSVSNLEITTDECRITAIFVETGNSLFSKRESIRIPWENIEKIGCDIIIVRCAPICRNDESCIKEKKRPFLGK